uniref:DUF4959 domain-containing protein n=1 Tax=uncultured Draconibacterium sp. TaxID=1573823 RepID=UPI0032170878
MKKLNYSIIFFVLMLGILACEEEGVRFASTDDKVPPAQPTNITYKPMYGGARFFYDLPSDEDLLQVEARYTNKENKSFSFSSSYFVDSLDVIGFGDTVNYKVELYAIDRAGNRSEPVIVDVKPMESAISRVAKSIIVTPGFSSFFIDWENELEQSINVYVDFSYTQAGEKKEHTAVFSSNLLEERRFIEDLYLTPEEKISVKLRVADIFGNETNAMDVGQISLYEDGKISKENWFLPEANDSIGGVPQAFGNGLEGRLRYVIDDIIDRGNNMNYMHTRGRGRTGSRDDGNMPWNVIIDLGDYYELSRIVTVQRHSGGEANISRGQYYQKENVGQYEMYIWDEETQEWEYVSEHRIPVPVGLSELQFVKKGEAGDMAYMYPDEPRYTKPTRWFRYRAMKSFNANYTREDANCLSEITLFGRKAAQ